MQSNRKSRRDYVTEAKGQPFELGLDNPVPGGPTYVTFKNPQRLESQTAFELNRETDTELHVRALLSEEDFAAWWAEWKSAPIEELQTLLDEVSEHYGANRGKPRR